MPFNSALTKVPDWIAELPTDFQVIEENMDRFARAAYAHEQWAAEATVCTNFLEGKQYSDLELKKLAREGRPVITKNHIAPLFRVLMGYQRQNRYEIKFMPGNDGTGTQDVSNALNAVAKQIAEKNQQEWVDSQVFQDGLTTGRGFWDCRLDFTDNGLGECKIGHKDPFSILIDPEADSYDPNAIEGGWNFVTETRWMSPIDVLMMYNSKAFDEISEFAQNGTTSALTDYTYDSHMQTAPDRYFGLDHFLSDKFTHNVGLYTSPYNHINQHRKLVRVIDTQHRRLKKVRYFYDLETGGQAVIPDSFTREQIAKIVEWLRIRNIPMDIREGYKKMVRWTVTAGNRVLWDEWSPYNEKMTIIPYFAYFRRGKTRGMIDDLIDPQREINRRASSMLHVIMTTANSGWMWEEGALTQDMERSLEQWGAKPGIHVKYREGFNAPQKIEPSAAPTSFQKLIVDSTSDLKLISGVNDSALGSLDRVQSGRAIQARQKQSIVGAETYFDNFARSRELLGRGMLNIIQKYYNEPRIIQTQKGKSNAETITINEIDAAGNILNNVTAGTFDIAIEESPLSATYLQGQFQEMGDLIDRGVPIPWDIAIEMSSLPNKEEIIRRIKEEHELAGNMQLLQNVQMRGQMGVPLEAPLPPVAVPQQFTQQAPQQMPQQQGGMLQQSMPMVARPAQQPQAPQAQQQPFPPMGYQQ
jgi:hypothetical protein